VAIGRSWWATVSTALSQEAAGAATLELGDVDRAFDRIQSVKGKSSTSERARLVSELLARARADEQQFLAALLVGEVRQGRATRQPDRLALTARGTRAHR